MVLDKDTTPNMSQRTVNSPNRFSNDFTKGALVIQYVTDSVSGRQFFRFLSQKGIEGYSPTAEEANERCLEIAKRLDLEIHADIIAVTL